jgi:lipoprotein-anchoring transpeptidase ErfK/SrfK
MHARTLLAAPAVALALIGLAACGGSDSAEPAAVSVTVTETTTLAETTTPDATNAPAAAPAPDATEATGSGRYTVAVPQGYHPVVWVRAGERVAMHTEPGGGALVETVGRKSVFGSPSVFGVERQKHGWVGVTTPDLPNNQLGWMRLDPDRLASGASQYSVVVDLSDYEATLYKGNDRVRSFSVTVGAPASPTPTGKFAVTDTFRGGLASAYGCCALALSATQPNLPSGWLGGNRIAIHGTYETIGVASSHGCVRAANEDVSKLIDLLPLGSPVTIRA